MHYAILYDIMPVVMKTCAFTGNRPSKLPWGYDEKDDRCVAVKNEITSLVTTAAEENFTHFLCGMAQGGDFYFAEAVLAVREKYPVTLECAVPYRQQSSYWSAPEKMRYEKILAAADKVTVLSERYTPWCNHVRNRYMVDNCTRLIALSYASSGGTQYTIEYARGKNVEIIYVK